ncbi:MAG: N-acetyltransferase [Actinomycetaceae bacterium]|nr:N-acetyltransferase [Actinomycetaceae bacterium]
MNPSSSTGDIAIYIKSSHLNSVEKTAVADLVAHADHEFIPPLSSRSSTTQQRLDLTIDSSQTASTDAYCRELETQSFVFAVASGDTATAKENIIAFLSYRPHTTLFDRKRPLSHYVSTIIVDPHYRGQGVAQRLYNALFAIADEQGVSVSTRTWSTNNAHIALLKKNHFNLITTIPNDRGEGLDTVYYERQNQH